MSKFKRKTTNTIKVCGKMPSSAIAVPVLRLLDDVKQLQGEVRLGNQNLEAYNKDLYDLLMLASNHTHAVGGGYGYDNDDTVKRYVSVLKNIEPIVRIQDEEYTKGIIVSHGLLHHLIKSVMVWYEKYSPTNVKVRDNYYFRRTDWARPLDVIFAVSESPCDIIESIITKHTEKLMRLRSGRYGYGHDETQLPSFIAPKVSSRYEKTTWFDLAYKRYKKQFKTSDWAKFQADKDSFRRNKLNPHIITAELAEALR
jgi:hypothetical protein